MISSIARTVLGAFTTFLGVALFVFILFHWVGGDPAYQMLGKHASERQIVELRREYGFDQPTYVQFFQFLKQIATWDLGHSYITKQSIHQMIIGGIGPSLSLMVPAFLILTVLALVIGMWRAYFQGHWSDKVTAVFCVLSMSVSMLTCILLGQYIFGYILGWFPISGYESIWPERVQYLALPIMIFVVINLGYEIRFYRSVFLEEVAQDYVRMARASGVSEVRILQKHVFRNCMIPIITHTVGQIPSLVLGACLLESFFGIPGLGSVTMDAVQGSDFPVIQAMTLLSAGLFMGAQITTDILYAWADPRVRHKR